MPSWERGEFLIENFSVAVDPINERHCQGWAGWTASRRVFTSESQSWIGAKANVETLGECVKESREARPHHRRHKGGGMCGHEGWTPPAQLASR